MGQSWIVWSSVAAIYSVISVTSSRGALFVLLHSKSVKMILEMGEEAAPSVETVWRSEQMEKKGVYIYHSEHNKQDDIREGFRAAICLNSNSPYTLEEE